MLLVRFQYTCLADTNGSDPSSGTTKEQLLLAIAKVRINLIQNDDELKELNQRIIKLQNTMIQKLDSHPEMKELLQKLEKTDE